MLVKIYWEPLFPVCCRHCSNAVLFFIESSIEWVGELVSERELWRSEKKWLHNEWIGEPTSLKRACMFHYPSSSHLCICRCSFIFHVLVTCSVAFSFNYAGWIIPIAWIGMTNPSLEERAYQKIWLPRVYTIVMLQQIGKYRIWQLWMLAWAVITCRKRCHSCSQKKKISHCSQ